jgi:hypothetical protein
MAVGRARFSWKLSFVLLGILALVSLKSPLAQQDGAFLDELNVRLISKGKIELLNDFRYRDSKNDIWKAPKGYVSDGASIPQVFWSVVGGGEFQKMKREIEQGNVRLEQIDAASDAVAPPNDQSKWRGARLRRAL